MCVSTVHGVCVCCLYHLCVTLFLVVMLLATPTLRQPGREEGDKKRKGG